MKRRKPQDLNKSAPKRIKKSRVSNPSDEIDKSQKLLQSKPKKTSTRKKQSLDQRNALGLVCGKPMPPLSELERMYEGSDEDMPAVTPGENVSLEPDGSITPNTAKKYADELLKILGGKEAPSQPKPMKKYKKPEVPYIVGCTERPRIPEKPNCNVFKGDDYGITSKTNALNKDGDHNCFNSTGLYTNGYSLSKSIFNAQANEIASKLLSNENNPVVSGSDSDDTVVYELNSPKSRFSPEPSTSKDSETILKNDQKFIKSFITPKKNYGEAGTTYEPFIEMMVQDSQLITEVDKKAFSNEVNSNSENSSQAKQTVLELVNNNIPAPSNDIEIIEQPYETIEISDDGIDLNLKWMKMEMDIDLKTRPCTYIKSESIRNNNSDTVVILDDICDIKDTNKTDNKIKTSNINTIDYPIVVDRYNPFDPKIIAEIDLTNFNIDDVISENQSLIDKYSKHNNLKTIHIVEANFDRPISVENTSAHINVINNKQFESKNNHINTIQTTNDHDDRHPSKYVNHNANELDLVVKRFFDKRGNTSLRNNQATGQINLSSQEKKFPECSLNNSVSSTIIREKNKGQSNNKNRSPINSGSNNSTVETPRQPSIGTCPICLDNLTRERVGSTNCGHLFCMPCITTALKTKPKRCPTCRKKLNGLGYHQIFL